MSVDKRRNLPEPVCTVHTDCFGNWKSRCSVLWDNDFGGRDCPFYNNREQYGDELQEVGIRWKRES